MELLVGHGIIRMREREDCASRIIARATIDYAPEIRLIHSDSGADGWRTMMTNVPGVITRRDLNIFEKYPDAIANHFVFPAGGRTWIRADINDVALNETSKIRGIFQKIARHTATVSYEDFEVYAFPAQVMDQILSSLRLHGKANLIERENVNIDMISRFKFTLEPQPVLTDESKTIMQTALDLGWFESPRPDTGKLSALSEELRMSEASLSVKLKMISRQLSRAYLETMASRS